MLNAKNGYIFFFKSLMTLNLEPWILKENSNDFKSYNFIRYDIVI
jgi:hypothetical protein